MTRYRMLVANPPHGAVDPDRAGATLGLAPTQFLGKARYTIPEIWFADQDPAVVDACKAQLEAAGCRVLPLDVGELTSVPERSRVRTFEFDDNGFVAHCEGGDVTVAYHRPLVGIFCRPREPGPDVGARRSRRTSSMLSYRDRLLEAAGGGGGVAGEAADFVPFLDLFVFDGTATGRIAVFQNTVSFSGLGRVEPRAANNMQALVESCEGHFVRARFDRRLVGMRVRNRWGEPRPRGAEHRAGYSFASPGLLELLGSEDPRLAEISQPELSSRLAYLTQRAT